MGLFSSLFGSAGSDKSDQLRQKAIDAFGSIKTPELAALQVQLQNYVNAGKLTPEQAEAQLINSNAFNNIKTDPSLTGAAKQALQRLQTIGTTGGMDAIAKARMADITSQQEQENKSANDAILSNARERGLGGSDLTTVNQLVGSQGAADRAARSGTQVAADAESRALAALTGAGSLGQSLEAQQYGEEANKAGAQNAIEQFNKQTQNATNLYNTQTANEAQAQNLQNAQNVANLSTQTQNQGKLYNSNMTQQQYEDQLQKAEGISGQYDQWAGEAQKAHNAEQGADASLLGGAINTGAAVGGYSLASPTVPSVPQASPTEDFGFNPKTMSKAPQGFSPYAYGGEVPSNENKADKGLEDEYREFVSKYCYGGSVKMADGGMVHIKAPKHYAEGGSVDSSTDTAHASLPVKKKEEDKSWLASLGSLLGSHADTANQILAESQGGVIPEPQKTPNENKATPQLPITPSPENENKWDLKDPNGEEIGEFDKYGDAAEYADKVRQKQPHIQDFLRGGKVPGIPKVSGDSPKNDIVPAKLSPGEVVLPRSVVAHPETIPGFVTKSISPTTEDVTSRALRKLKNPMFKTGGAL